MYDLDEFCSGVGVVVVVVVVVVLHQLFDGDGSRVPHEGTRYGP